MDMLVSGRTIESPHAKKSCIVVEILAQLFEHVIQSHPNHLPDGFL